MSNNQTTNINNNNDEESTQINQIAGVLPNQAVVGEKKGRFKITNIPNEIETDNPTIVTNESISSDISISNLIISTIDKLEDKPVDHSTIPVYLSINESEKQPNDVFVAPQKTTITNDDKQLDARSTDDTPGHVQTAAAPKKGRFTVKAVPKKDEECDIDLTNDSVNHKLTLHSPITNNHHIDYPLSNQSIQSQLEQLLIVNSKILQTLMDNHKSTNVSEITYNQNSNTHLITQNNNSISMSNAPVVEREKEKSFHRIYNHLSEMKKEVEALQKQKKDWQLESQRLRERCQQLEERLTSETIRCTSLEERLEKSKVTQKTMKALIDQQQSTIDNQNSLILSLQSKSSVNDIT
mmetsp:Transcript_23465/g.21338  ORF Transcript_23465/g.21338 Transcript_23465/m.21338 type:complete len:352 (-) Transcript_23465:80-1135(-)